MPPRDLEARFVMEIRTHLAGPNPREMAALLRIAADQIESDKFAIKGADECEGRIWETSPDESYPSHRFRVRYLWQRRPRRLLSWSLV